MALGIDIIKSIVFAAGKSTRMGTGRSKMLEIIEKDCQKKPMIIYTTDLMTSMGYNVVVLIGYDGTAVINAVLKENKKKLISWLRVSQDDGSDLEPNTGGTLRKYADEIAEGLEDNDQLLLCVADQPFMQIETVQQFVKQHIQLQADASILLTHGNGILEQSTSTRVSINADGKLTFNTPPENGPFDKSSFLIDVGVLLIKKSSFLHAVRKLNREDVFGKLLCNLPLGHDRINTVVAADPHQFKNINEMQELGRLISKCTPA